MFLIETPAEGTNCSVYWIAQEFGEIEFIGTIAYSKVLADDAIDNLLGLYLTDSNVVCVGHVDGMVPIGRIYQKGEYFWHHVFTAEKRKTASSAARAAYRMHRRHRTAIGDNVLREWQSRRNF
jgi:hypothetical protein